MKRSDEQRNMFLRGKGPTSELMGLKRGITFLGNDERLQIVS